MSDLEVQDAIRKLMGTGGASPGAVRSTATATPGPDSPPIVTRGANAHKVRSVAPGKVEREVCIDWLRFTLPAYRTEDARRTLQDFFGPSAAAGGGFFLEGSHKWGSVRLYHGGKPWCIAEIPAGALRELDPSAVLDLARQLMGIGGRPTRVDVAVDHYGDVARLIPSIVNACGDGELCGARAWKPHLDCASGAVTALGVSIGRRGKDGSGRYVRCYDKGLETGDVELGRWVRWEAEFTDDCAAQALEAIMDDAQPWAAAGNVAYGACDFREATGARAYRRKRSAWWAEWLRGFDPARVVASRLPSTPVSFARWVSTAVCPKLATLAAAAGMSFGTMVQFLGGDLTPRADLLADAVVRGVLHEAGADPWVAEGRVRLLSGVA